MHRFFQRLFGHKTSAQLPETDPQLSLTTVEIISEVPNVPATNSEELEIPIQTDLIKSSHIEPSVPEATPYESALDLRNYQYPILELLGSPARIGMSALIYSSPDDLLPIIWGRREDRVVFKDLAAIGSLLVCGTQATGKTNFLHQLILSLLFKKHPSQLKLVLVDTKGLEFGTYAIIERHFLAKLPGQSNTILREVIETIRTLEALCLEMSNRYELLQSAGVKNISAYNARFVSRTLDLRKGHQYLPAIVLVIDDLGSFSYHGSSDIFTPLIKLVTEGYKVGIYCVLSTSQTGGHALPGNLLGLITQRVVFRLNGKEDYRRFFDTTRFDIPYSQGHFLFNEGPGVYEGASIFIEQADIDKVVDFIGSQMGYPQAFLLPEYTDEQFVAQDFSLLDRDPLFEEAARLIVQNQIGSTSLIQRRMKLGYNRAGRLMEQLEAAGIVGVNQGSKARDVLIKTDAELDRLLVTLG